MTNEFAEYQKAAFQTAGGYNTIRDLQQLGGLGLAGESGEVADLIKKKYYHPHKDISDLDIITEMGDVLWYLAILAESLKVSLAEVALMNINKLKVRYPDGFPEE